MYSEVPGYPSHSAKVTPKQKKEARVRQAEIVGTQGSRKNARREVRLR